MLLSREAYDKLVKERDELQSALATATAQVAEKDAKIAELEAQAADTTTYDETAAEVETLRQTVAAKDEEIRSLQAETEKTVALNEELKSVISDLRSLKNSWQPDTRDNTAGGQSNVDKAKSVDIDRALEVAETMKKSREMNLKIEKK